MIRSFADKRTAALFGGRRVRGISDDLARQARKRLALVADARDLADLAARKGNRLEALRGDREGQWSIRVNDQWRICFAWRGNEAHDVEFVDYH
jgi:toxin HigB-1